jgi:hypothetical protein
MDWDWLVGKSKLCDRQNRLGFVVELATNLSTEHGEVSRAKKLHEKKTLLERSRLMREDTLCHDSMTSAERKWLQNNRPPEAKYWNLLTDLDVEHLAHAFL